MRSHTWVMSLPLQTGGARSPFARARHDNAQCLPLSAGAVERRRDPSRNNGEHAMQTKKATKEPRVDFDRFHSYADLCNHVKALAAWKPDLCEVRTIGRSVEGRDILLLAITDSRSGTPDAKPGFLVHGNIHAVEVSGSACALYLAHYLLSSADQEPVAADLLDRFAFHIIPRVCVDGAEEALVRQHPVRSRETVQNRKNCITPMDINGDGHIRAMRVPDPAGPCFAPDDEPRLVVPRLPGDTGGQRYRLATEGLIHDWDGGTWSGPAATGYDFNRNWAEEWRPRHRQWGAGRYPFSEPEVRAIADYVLDHPQLGRVELGGFVPEVFYNVIPEQRLDVWDRARRFLFELARRGPSLELSGVSAAPLGNGLFRVACSVTNEGLLPTHVTALGAGLSHIEGICVELERSGSIAFVSGRNRTELGHLGVSERRELAWVVKADPGAAITIVAHGPRAGRCEARVALAH
jgi:Zinc carboxypeptidase